MGCNQGRGDNPCVAEETVAFTAKLRISDSYPKHTGVLKLADVVVNKGGGYDPSSGVFTCPKAGLYYFSVHISSYGRSQVFLQKNDTKVLSLYHTTLPEKLSQVASMSGVIDLAESDTVQLSLWGPCRNDIFASVDNDTLFVGVRLG